MNENQSHLHRSLLAGSPFSVFKSCSKCVCMLFRSLTSSEHLPPGSFSLQRVALLAQGKHASSSASHLSAPFDFISSCVTQVARPGTAKCIVSLASEGFWASTRRISCRERKYSSQNVGGLRPATSQGSHLLQCRTFTAESVVTQARPGPSVGWGAKSRWVWGRVARTG